MRGIQETVMAKTSQPDTPDNKSSIAQSYLKAAKDRLHTTQEAFLSTQKNYLQAREALVKEQHELSKAKANIDKLTDNYNSLVRLIRSDWWIYAHALTGLILTPMQYRARSRRSSFNASRSSLPSNRK